MFRINTTKIRTAIAMLVAASSVALTTAPVIGTASAAPKKPTSHELLCDVLYSMFAADVNAADNAYKAGNMQTFKSALANATADLNTAKEEGCDWAARLATPRPIIAPVGRATQ